MNKEQFKIVGHSLGINTYHAEHSEIEKDKYLPEEFYRNYYCWGNVESTPSAEWEELVRNELAVSDVQREQIYYFVTDKGIQKFRDLFTIQVTQEFKPPSKGRSKYLDYIHADYCDSFSDFLGIQMPKREHGKGGVRFVSTKYPEVRGGFMSTIKEAKVSYKEKLKEYKKIS